MCNKIFYENKADCVKHIKVMRHSRIKHKKPNVKYSPYKCPACEGWHLTSKTKRAAKRHKKFNRKLNELKG